MSESKEIKNWLERLQQESWNLELLISGFSVLLLLQARSSLLELVDYIDLFYDFSQQFRNVIMMFLGITILSCYALIISLVIHIFLRGFWVGAVGLRSVQPRVDFRRLRYTPAFEQYLHEKLPTLDRLIIRLDQICSAIFSFAFLIIFMLVSLAAWFLVLSLINIGINIIPEPIPEDSVAWQVLEVFAYAITIIFAIISLLYLIDTLSLGIFKKIKRIGKGYRWIYRVMNTITLSFLYRSIYYHLISYIGIWRSRLLLTMFIFSMLTAPYARLTHAIFYPDYFPDNEIATYYYDDTRTEDDIIWGASISSSVIESNNLPLFIRYSPSRNKTLLHLCEGYEPAKVDKIIWGIRWNGVGFDLNDPYIEENSPDSLLNCLSSVYQVSINDSLNFEPQYYYFTHPNKGELGIYTVLDISTLPKGHHQLKIDYKVWREKQDTIITREWLQIPFWKTSSFDALEAN